MAKRIKKIKPFVKLISLAAIIFLALFFIMGYIWKAAGNSGYFKVTSIITRGPEAIDLSYLEGRNIFSIDLKLESAFILKRYPDFRNIRLAKVLPDRIFADFIRRRPVALIKLYKDFCVDDNQVLFYQPEGSQDQGLPLITGLESKIRAVRPGARYNLKEVTLALGIIREIKNNKSLEGYGIKRIDVSNPASTSIFISFSPEGAANQALSPQLLEVKIGDSSIKNKIAFLSGVLLESGRNLLNIKYIDLRFKSPVVKFK